MTDPLVVDAFKFIAVRPPQLASADDTQRTIIRDRRAETADGKQQLSTLGRGLVQREQAQRRWDALDLGALEPLIAGHKALVRIYGAPPEDGVASDLNATLVEAGLDDLTQAESLADDAWDALYIARMTGADAGQRLDGPMAALRALHFVAQARSDEALTRDAADQLLFATPAVPEAAAVAAPPSDRPERVRAESATRPELEQMHELIDEFDAVRELVRVTGSTPPTPAGLTPVIEQVTVGREDQPVTQTQVSISTIPSFTTALAARLGDDHDALLSRLQIDQTTSLPAAATLLSDHLTSLTERALDLRNDPDFLSALSTRSQPSSLTKIVPGDKVGFKTIDLVGAVFGRPDPSSPHAPDVDVRGKIRPLGVGDLKVVKQTLLAYVPGEVAHIENVLTGESKERSHRTLDRVENIIFSSEEETTATERDTQSTERFELKREAEQTIKEDMSVQAGVTVTGSYGPVSITAHGDFAYSTSKQESQKSSSNFARDIVDRSVSKVQKRVKTERTTKTLREVEEINKHGLDNKLGTEHVVGVYRWVDKRYRAQVYNYGVRQMLEFIVPEPAAFFRASQLRQAVAVIGATPPEPFVDMKGNPLTAAAITPATYGLFASRYNTSAVVPPPPHWVYIGGAFGEGGLALGATTAKAFKELTVPEGYELRYYEAGIGIIWGGGPNFILQVGGDVHHILNNSLSWALMSTTGGAGTALWAGLNNPLEPGPRGVIPVSVAAYDVTGYSINLGGHAECSADKYASWQLQTFEKIRTAYQAAKSEYEQKLSQAEAAAGILIQGRNPGINREIEQRELKKLCITMLTGQHFKSFDAMTDPDDQPTHHPEVNIDEARREGRVIQFFEQAFEWEHMTYLFYPYFWGRKENWIDAVHEADPDPLFTQFRQAGAARVVLPVRPAYNADVQYYLQASEANYTDRIWGGGPVPTVDTEDDRYVSIAEELRNRTDDLHGATPEDEPWEFNIPTTLVWLQQGPELPTFE